MIDSIESERRRTFSVWLRTGRLPVAHGADGRELKFNPWHDPRDGRFTFAGRGKYYAQGWGDDGFTGGGGGKSGGGGATGPGWETAEERKQRERAARARAATPAAAPKKPTPIQSVSSAKPIKTRVTLTWNGYAFELDANAKVREISGEVDMAQKPHRSRTAQARAGGTDRRPTDDGGHYIAPRFNGPTDAFNHFAQDANFNRGKYHALEDEWEREKKRGKKSGLRSCQVTRDRRSAPQWSTYGSKSMESGKASNFPMRAGRQIVQNSATERLLAEIASLLAEDEEYPLNGTLLYAEVDRAYVAPSIFKNLGNQILYRGPDLDRLGEALLDLWKAQDKEPRWTEIEYLIENGRFTATFTYRDEIDTESMTSLDRRQPIVRRYFGDKPIVYPPRPDDDDAPAYEL